MSRILIGSSNVYRNYKAANFKYNEYAMVRCVDLESLDAHLTNLEPNETEVVISVLENILDKAARGGSGEEREKAIDIVIKSFLGVVEDAAMKNPGTKFVLIDPIRRPKLDWYDNMLDEIKKKHKEVFNSMGLGNTSRVDVLSWASQEFEEDGVHLTKEAGKVFVGGILNAAEAIFQAGFIDIADDDNRSEPKPTSANGVLERRIDRLEANIDERRWNDNLLFARTREELDMAANKLKEDRVVMTGLTSSTPPPSDRAQKNLWLRKLVIDTMKKIKPDFDGTISFINQGKNNGKEIPMVEVKLNSVEAATGLRKAFAEKRKEGDGKSMGRLYVANSVSLSTRVRIDVMKAVAKKLTVNKDTAHVASYSSRPILHVKTSRAGSSEVISRAYTFVDTIIRYGSILNLEDLEEAYKKAGSAFKGQLEQHFVVLREGVNPTVGHGSTASRGSASGRGGRGGTAEPRKRPREKQSTSTSGNWQSDKRSKADK
jgi:hypothetical protein